MISPVTSADKRINSRLYRVSHPPGRFTRPQRHSALVFRISNTKIYLIIVSSFCLTGGTCFVCSLVQRSRIYNNVNYENSGLTMRSSIYVTVCCDPLFQEDFG